MENPFIQLVRLGIGHCVDAPINVFDWNYIKSLAEQHGLSAIVVDGIERLPENQRPPKDLLLEWIGEVLQGYEYRYKEYCSTIAEMARFYNSHGYKMMVLKGYSCSLNWPNPAHRPCGDIDIWLFGKQKEADSTLTKEIGINVDTSEHHHTVFFWNGFMVENHYDFINVYHHKSHSKLERLYKELGKDDSFCTQLLGDILYLPSPNLHALFLLKHTMLHFVSGEINLRQLLDWALFVEKHTKEVDWVWLEKTLDEFGMIPLYRIFNAICVEDLGFNLSCFPNLVFDPFLKDKVLKDILGSKSKMVYPNWIVKRAIYRFRRWKASSWKHKLCYKESMWSAFWCGVWGHIIKPSSI